MENKKHLLMPRWRGQSFMTMKLQYYIEFGPESYVVNYGFIYALCGGQVCLGFLHGKC